MSRGTRVWLLAAIIVVGGGRAGGVQAQDSGRLLGRAVAAENGRPLEGASVSVAGTTLKISTDANGRFLFPRVAAGTYDVTLTYIGRETLTQAVTVRPGNTVVVEYNAPIAAVVLEGLKAFGARANTQAEALNRQKNAQNIMNIVASDQIARFPDASAPEAVQRLPGVAVARDQGEGRYIQIRGGSAANTQVSFNGVQIPSPEGTARQIALDAVPVDILESIEVSKAILPSTEADAIGGAVNLITRRAPTTRLLSIEGFGGYASIREEAAGGGAVTLGNRVMNDRLGFLVSGSFSRRNFGSDDVEPAYDVGATSGLADDALTQLSVRHYSLWRSRAGATGTLDYRVSDNSSLSLTGIHSELVDHEQRRQLLHLVSGNELQFRHKNRREELQTRSATLAGKHLLNRVQVEHVLAWTRSSELTPFDDEIRFRQRNVTFAPDLSDPDRVQTNPAAGAIDGRYLFDRVEPASSDTRNTDRVAGLDLSVPYALGHAAGSLRIGVRYRDKAKDQDVRENQFRLRSGATAIALGEGFGAPFDGTVNHPARYPLPGVITTPADVSAFRDRFASQLSGGSVDEENVNDYDLSERVGAAYAMTELNLTSRLMLLPGVRYENTRLRTDGFQWDTDTEVLTPTHDSNSYGNVFPMVHARLALGARSNVRAAFTTAIARPNFYDLVPYRLRDDEDLELGNPDLKPTTSRNFDLMLEYYDSRIGVLSAGGFYRLINSPIFAFTTANELGGVTTQPQNGESGWVRGVELAVQQQLRMLPAPFDGLGIYTNYTFTDSEATLASGRVARMQGQAEHVFNGAVSYERGPFSGQVSFNHHADFVDGYGGDSADDRTDVFTDAHSQLDLSANLRLRAWSSLFLEVNNITNEPFRAFQGVRQRPVQLEYYERWARLGMRVAL